MVKMAADSSSSSCPYDLADLYRLEWINYSSIWNNISDSSSTTSNFDDYCCRAARLYSLREHCISFNGHAYLIFGIIGLLSSVFSLIVFYSREYTNGLGYVLYKSIAALELVHMTVMILLGLRHFMDCGLYFWCQFLSAHFTSFLLNTSAEAVDFIVLFLCIERSIACLLPAYFKRVHHKSIFVSVATAALMFSAVTNFPIVFQLHVEYNTKFQRYNRPLSPFGSSSVFRHFSDMNAIRLCLTGALIIAATCSSIAGLLRARRHQRRLSRRRRLLLEENHAAAEMMAKNGQSGATTHLYEHVVEMCVLQLCLAVPAVFNYLLLATMRIAKLERVYWIGEEAFLHDLNYEQALDEIKYFSRYHVLNSAVLSTNFLAHSFHFYLYLIFCANIRRSFKDLCLGFVDSTIERVRKLCKFR